jgi:hypothetical protein
MRLHLILPVLAMACLFAGCETTAPYTACPLDKEVTDKGICNGTSTSTSCVVRKHPQCEQAICLSYFGTAPLCTQPCTADKDCPGDAITQNGVLYKPICWTFAPADVTGTTDERYCVPASTQAGAAAK